MSAAEVAILARIVAAVEAGEALPVEEAALVDRLRKTAPRPAPRRWREERAALIVDYAYRFARDAHSVRAKAVRLIAELNRFCNGEWQHLQHRVECPFPASDRRAVLWMLLKLGPPPGLTVIREALTESLARIPATA